LVLAKTRKGKGVSFMENVILLVGREEFCFRANDPTGIGCDLAANQVRRNEFFIVGVDGSPDGAATLKSKGSLFEATPA
jgi:ribose transport system substrate-binding protein